MCGDELTFRMGLFISIMRVEREGGHTHDSHDSHDADAAVRPCSVLLYLLHHYVGGTFYCISTVIFAINGSSSNQNRNMVCKRTGIYAWYVRMALESIVGPDYILYYYCTTITTLLSLVFLWPMPPIVGVVSAAQSCCLVVLFRRKAFRGDICVV